MVTIAGVQHLLWRAADQDGTVLDILVQSRMRRRGPNRSNSAGNCPGRGICNVGH